MGTTMLRHGMSDFCQCVDICSQSTGEKFSAKSKCTSANKATRTSQSPGEDPCMWRNSR